MGRVLLLIVGFVAALGLGASAQQPPQGEQRPGTKEAASSQQSPIRTAELKGDGERGEDQAEAEDQTSPLEQSDLAAQWAMAGFAGLQVLLTFGGLIYIRWTLLETRKAVKEARDATALAEGAFSSQHENARRELRAYISVDAEKAGPWRIGQRPAIRFIIKNTGQTPARRLSVYGRVQVGVPGDETEIEIEEYDVVTSVLGGGSQMTRERGTKPMTSDNLRMIASGQRALFCKGMVVYEDVFGDKQVTRFSVEFGTADDLPRFHKTWNDAT